MKKAFRELMRIAEREGIEKPYIDPGMPHARLCGFVDGEPFEIVVSLTKADAYRGPEQTRTNIRREMRRIRAQKKEQPAP